MTAFRSKERIKVGFVNKEGDHSSLETFSVVDGTFLDYCVDFNQIYLHILTDHSLLSWSLMTRTMYSSVTTNGKKLQCIKQSLLFAVTSQTSIRFMQGYECGQDLKLTPFGTCTLCTLDIRKNCLSCFKSVNNKQAMEEAANEKLENPQERTKVYECLQCQY